MKIGIIGAGHIAGKMSKTLACIEGVERWAVASRDLAKAQAFASEFGFARAYGSYEELVEDPDVDLVYVATPHSHHAAHMKLCIEHGKAVLCEKAFTCNAREAEEVLAFARERGVLVAEAMWTRYMPFSKTIREVMESGIIGTPQMLSANLGYSIEWKERIVRPELGGGALLDLGVYCLNFADMYFGLDYEGLSTSCVKNAQGMDMQETVTLTYADGRMTVLHMSARCATDRHGVISGSEGFIVVDNINNPRHLDVYSKTGQLLDSRDAPDCISGYEYEVISCGEALSLGLCEAPQMSAETILRIMRLCDALRAEWGVRFPAD